MQHQRRPPPERRTLNDTRPIVPSRAARYGGRHARRGGSFWSELPFLVLTAIVLAVLVKGFLIQAFFIPSRSMQPTLEAGDRVLVNRLSYRVGEPQRGEVVVFQRSAPGAAPSPGALSWVRRAVAQGLGGTPPGSEDLIKRVVGLPGDTLEGRNGLLWRNGAPLAEPYLPAGMVTADFGPVTVEPGRLWVMGDNRGDSADSRAFGAIPRSSLVGHAVVRVWPVGRLGGL